MIPIRKKICIGLGALIILFILFVSLALGPIVALLIESKGSRILGAKINVEKVAFGLVSGSVDVQGLQMADPEATDRNMFQARRMYASISIWPLFAGRVVVKKLLLEEPLADVARSEDGRINIQKIAKPPEEKKPEKSILEKTKEQAKRRDWWNEIKECYEKYQAKRKAQQEQAKKQKAAKKKVVRVEKGRFGEKVTFPEIETEPDLLVHSAEAKGLTIKFEDKAKQSKAPSLVNGRIAIENLAIRPGLGPAPLKFDFAAGIEGGANGSVGLKGMVDLIGEKSIQEFMLELKQFDLAAFAPLYAESWPVVFESGLADLKAHIKLDGDALDSIYEARVRNLSVTGKEKDVLGIPPKDVREVFKTLGEFPISFRVWGTLTEPQTDLPEKLIALLKERGVDVLKKYGERRAKEEIEKRKEKLGEKADELREKLDKKLEKKLDPDSKKKIDDALDVIGGKIGIPSKKASKEETKKEGKEQGEEKGKKPEDVIGEGLKSILGK